MNKYSKYIDVKSAIEDLFGSDAWYALKESNHVPTWRRYATKTLSAARLAITDTVEVYDSDWQNQICARLDEGIEALRLVKEVDEIIGVLAGTMIEVSFMQIGNMPRCKGRKVNAELRKGAWKLNGFRSVAYLQTAEQKEALFLTQQRQCIGLEKQLDLRSRYQHSKSTLSYREWCNQDVASNGSTTT